MQMQNIRMIMVTCTAMLFLSINTSISLGSSRSNRVSCPSNDECMPESEVLQRADPLVLAQLKDFKSPAQRQRVYLSLAEIGRKLGKSPDSATHYREAIRIDADPLVTLRAQIQLAELLNGQGREQEALDALSDPQVRNTPAPKAPNANAVGTVGQAQPKPNRPPPRDGHP
jgi:hypothetical protein